MAATIVNKKTKSSISQQAVGRFLFYCYQVFWGVEAMHLVAGNVGGNAHNISRSYYKPVV